MDQQSKTSSFKLFISDASVYIALDCCWDIRIIASKSGTLQDQNRKFSVKLCPLVLTLAIANDPSCSITGWLTVQASVEEAFGRSFLVCSSLRLMSWFTSVEVFTRRHGLGFKLQESLRLTGFALLVLFIIQNISHM